MQLCAGLMPARYVQHTPFFAASAVPLPAGRKQKAEGRKQKAESRGGGAAESRGDGAAGSGCTGYPSQTTP